MSDQETIQLNQVKVTSEFWQRYRDLVVKEVLPYQWEVMNDQANIDIADTLPVILKPLHNNEILQLYKVNL